MFPYFAHAQDNLDYQTPPEPLNSLVDITPPPLISVAPDNKTLLLIHRNFYKTIEEVSQDELRLAGVRINPKNYTQSRQSYYTNVELLNVETGQITPVSGIPKEGKFYNLSYSPSGEKFAILNAKPTQVELWVVDIESAKAEKLMVEPLNDVLSGSPIAWKADGSGIFVKVRGSASAFPEKPLAPSGPTIQQADGKKSTIRTYQDLLKNTYDESVFEYFITASLLELNFDGTQRTVLSNELIRSFSVSPSGDYLLYSTLKKPFSYLVTWGSFPSETWVLNLKNFNDKTLIFDKPLTINLPQGFDATSTGKRFISWRDDAKHTLVWVEALDGGDPKTVVEFRDEVFTQEAPFNKAAKSFAKTKLRFAGIDWGNNTLAIVYDRWWKDKKANVYAVNPSKGPKSSRILFELNTEDRYADPGSFLSERNSRGISLLKIDKNETLYLTGQGFGPEGNRPFLDAYNLKNGLAKRLWQADGDSTYENITRVLDIEKGLLLTRIESQNRNPNYFIRNFKQNELTQITNIPDPYEQFRGVGKQQIKYTRNDGVELNATLYLPEGYNMETDGKLPGILWAYPREFKSDKTAGQITKSPHTYTFLYYGSPVYWAAMGYAVVDDAAFPIIGKGEAEPNDTFVEQLVANAEAAINHVSNAMGILDANRVGVGGHSYGAFMTANLLAHSNLFAAGIARSGAYNRTLTPFGFQGEERTFWQAPDVYSTMSPFMNADKIKTPILLIHGDSDNNSGTFPIQSERLFEAIKGLGGTARLVMLPNESHGYAAKESVLHMIWEQHEWLEKYVKNKPAQ